MHTQQKKQGTEGENPTREREAAKREEKQRDRKRNKLLEPPNKEERGAYKKAE